MKTHDSTSIRERRRTAATWASLIALLALALLALQLGDFGEGTPPHAAAGNLLIASTPADRELLGRMEARSRFAQAVLDGRMTLLQAAASCRDLDKRSPSFNLERFRRHAPGKSDEERYCRLVISGVEGLLATGHVYDDQTASRLHGELTQHLQDGTLKLPPPRQLVD